MWGIDWCKRERILDTIAMATVALEGRVIQMPSPRSPSKQKSSLMTNHYQCCHYTPSLILPLPNIYPASISPSAGSLISTDEYRSNNNSCATLQAKVEENTNNGHSFDKFWLNHLQVLTVIIQKNDPISFHPEVTKTIK